MHITRKLIYVMMPLAVINSLILANRGYFKFRADPVGDLNRADYFIVLGFGIVRGPRGRDEPGRSNLALAKWLLANNTTHKPAIIQYGVHLALKELGETDLDEWTTVLPDHEDIHVDTRAALLQAWALTDKRGLRRPVIVCMPMQTVRALWIANRMMEEVVLPSLPDMPFEAESTQWWTRGPLLYGLFELMIARPMGFVFGWFDLHQHRQEKIR